MDSRNYRLKGNEGQVLKKEIKKVFRLIEKKLKQKKVIQRKRIVKNYKTLMTAVMLYIVQQKSFQALADEMAARHVKMSDTAWKKQLNKLAPLLFWAMLEYVSNKSKEWSYCKAHKVLNRFQTYILDATKFSAEGGSGVAMQVHTQISLTDLSDLYMKITDCHAAESVNHFKIHKDALYMADRAYGIASQFAVFIRKNANFIIRISPKHIALYRDKRCRQKINWEKLLSKSPFSIPCYFKLKKVIFKLRLVGRMIPQEKHPEIEKRVRRKASKSQYQVTQTTIDYSKWVLLATSVAYVKAADILDFYRLRWKIELFFKKTKTLLHFRKLCRSSLSFQKNQVLLWVSLILFISQFSSLPLCSNLSDFRAFSFASSACLSFFR